MTASGAILVTGASGFIGRHTCEAALTRGYRVRALTRKDWLGPPWVPVRDRFLGAFPFNLPATAFAGVEGIVHLAGTTGGEHAEAARAVNVEGTRRLLELAQRHGVRKIVFVSSQSARASAASAYGRTKFEAEQVLLQGPVPATIIRPGLVVGNGDRGLFARITRIATRAPVLPLPGGGRAIVQPIHVDDLAEAICRCLATGKYEGDVLKLGDPIGVTLADLLRMTIGTERHRRTVIIPVPIGPVISVVKALESGGMTLPVSTSNLYGLANSETMETGPDLQKLGLTLRPLPQALAGTPDRRRVGAPSPPSACLASRALRVVLVGAGRIGLIHAISIERQGGMRLAAIVDKSRRAVSFLRRIGVGAPGYESLERAIGAVRPDAVVIATPPGSHYALARAGAKAGLSVLVEKPLAASQEQLARFEEMGREHRIQVGYFAPSFPHFQAAIDRLRAGQFGRVQAFDAFCLLSYFPGTRRWETSRAHSAGGVLVNSGGHILSMILTVFGAPRSINAEQARRAGTPVEDSVVATLDYPTFSGRVWSSWAIEGFPQPENRLVIFTDTGVLCCTNSAAMFISTDRGWEWFSHQLDADVGFNVSPENVGAGIASELCQLQRMAREGSNPGMDVRRAIEVDEMLFTIYERSKEVARFSTNLTGAAQREPEHVGPQPIPGDQAAGREKASPIVLDIRRLRIAGPSSTIDRLKNRWDRFLAHAAQVRFLLAAGVPPERITVAVPDFLNHARRLSSGRVLEFFRSLGATSTLAFAWHAARKVLSSAELSFWTVVESMTAAELRWIPRHFAGTILVDSFPTDLAVSLDRAPRLDSLIRLIRSRLTPAGIGLQTNILPDAANLLVYLRQPVQAVHFLTSPRNPRLEQAILLLKSSPRFATCLLVAEARSLPASALVRAATAPLEWANGADALVVDAAGDPGMAPFIRDALADAWARAFPGAPLPEAVL